MLLQSPVSYSGFATNMAANAEKPAYYSHTLPEHGSEIVNEGKWQPSKEPEVAKPGKKYGVVYERQRTSEEQGEGHLERLISVQEVADSLQLNPGTVRYWVATGRLKERGRVWLAKPGGRGTPLVSQAEAESLKNEITPKGRLPQRRTKRKHQK
jgi:hypothetical protein